MAARGRLGGELVAGPLDRFAHMQPTESVVKPGARMGFLVEVPEETTRLRLRMQWPAGVEMHLMAHGPHEAGMPTYMDGWPDAGETCIEVPADEVLPGTWRVMAHAEDTARDLAFTITVETAGAAPPQVLDGAHGHDMTEDGDMRMEEPVECAPPP